MISKSRTLAGIVLIGALDAIQGKLEHGHALAEVQTGNLDLEHQIPGSYLKRSGRSDKSKKEEVPTPPMDKLLPKLDNQPPKVEVAPVVVEDKKEIQDNGVQKFNWFDDFDSQGYYKEKDECCYYKP